MASATWYREQAEILRSCTREKHPRKWLNRLWVANLISELVQAELASFPSPRSRSSQRNLWPPAGLAVIKGGHNGDATENRHQGNRRPDRK
jgi:hypothetical protein